MKITIRFCTQWGQTSTKQVKINVEWKVADLKQQIKLLTEIEVDEQILTIDEEELDDERLLISYSLEDQFIYVNQRQQNSIVEVSFHPQTQMRYFQKLGIIQEEQVDEEEKVRKSTTEDVEEFIMFVKNNNWKQAQEIMIRSNIQVDDRSLGWNAFHYACFQGLVDIVQQLLKLKVDVNLPTKDSRFPLQLALTKQRYQCVKLLLEVEKLNVNVGFRLILEQGELSIFEQMVRHPSFDANYLPNALSQSHVSILMKYQKDKKPLAQKGYCKKVNAMRFFHYKRYFVLDPEDGTLTRYKEEKDHPLNPVEVISLSDIQSVQESDRLWYMKSDHFYLTLFYNGNQKMIICSKSDKTIQNWKKALLDSIGYYKKYETNLKQSIDNLSFLKDDKYEYNIIRDSKLPTRLPEEIQSMMEKSKNLETQIQSPNISPKRTLAIESQPQYLKGYQILKQIGQGTFGKVFLVRQKETKQIFAMKQLDKNRLIQKKQIKFAVSECQILRSVRSPYIINLHHSFQTLKHMYLVMDYCSGGDVQYHLSKYKKFPEKIVRLIIQELVLAIEYLHSIDIIYRDLKPENILIHNGHVKLIDFGLSKKMDTNKAKSFCGTPAYLAPEMLAMKGANQATDVYGIGAVMFELLTGDPPYFDDDIEVLYENIKNGNLQIPTHLSRPCQQLLIGLLQREPSKRIGCRNPAQVTFSHIKKSDFFNWESQEKLPFQDQVDCHLTQSYSHILNDEDYNEENAKVNRILNWTFEA